MSRFHHILCATDFSASSARAVSRAVELAHESSAKLTLLHVVERFPIDRSNEFIAPENLDPVEYRKQQAEAALAKEAQRLGHPEIRHEVVICKGGAGSRIVEYAKASGCDLVVVGGGAHRRTKMSQLWSVAGCIQRRAPMTVEVVMEG